MNNKYKCDECGCYLKRYEGSRVAWMYDTYTMKFCPECGQIFVQYRRGIDLEDFNDPYTPITIDEYEYKNN